MKVVGRYSTQAGADHAYRLLENQACGESVLQLLKKVGLLRTFPTVSYEAFRMQGPHGETISVMAED